MVNDHYFTPIPSSERESHPMRVHLAGRDITVQTGAGVFSAGRVDRGTGILLDAVSSPPAEGNLLDLGCGWGPIALSMALQSPSATVWAVDVNERALELTRLNAAAAGCSNVHTATPKSVPEELTFREIWSNPPIRVGKEVLHDMLRTWLPRLEPGGVAHLVVAKQLGSDSLLRWMNSELSDYGLAERTCTEAGYRVLSFTRNREP